MEIFFWAIAWFAIIFMALFQARMWYPDYIKEKRRKERVKTLRPKPYTRTIRYGRSLLKFCRECEEVHGNYRNIEVAVEIAADGKYERCREDAKNWITKRHNESAPVYDNHMRRAARYERARRNRRQRGGW